MKYKLSDICYFGKEKIAVDTLNEENYISTENMLPNKGGIVKASSLPTIAQVNSFGVGDVLVSNIRPYFKKVWHAEFEGGCSNDVLVFKTEEGIDSYFLYYVLANDDFFAYSMATSKGTKMPRGDKIALMEYKVPKYSFYDQRKISSVLTSIDRKILINNDINENLEQQATAFFYHLFIENADPFWREGTISDLGTVVGGSTPSKAKSEYYTDNGIAWITPKDLSIDKSKFISHGADDITELGLRNSSATIMPAGTVLFSSRAPIGYIAIADGEVTTNQGFKSVVPFDYVGTAYVYFFLKNALPTIESMASGSTFKEISGSAMRTVPALIPDNNSLREFSEFCEPLFHQQRILEMESRALAALRDSLLPKLMSGELDISNLDL